MRLWDGTPRIPPTRSIVDVNIVPEVLHVIVGRFTYVARKGLLRKRWGCIRTVTGMLQSSMRSLEHHSLLRIDGESLSWRDPEELGVESEGVSQKVAPLCR